MRSYRMNVAYDGTAYCGWQVQPGEATVQEMIERALQRIIGSSIRVVASGRTDSGVHARGQVVSFSCDTNLEPTILCRALDANTPDDICIEQVSAVPFGFHAIRDAISKRYRYVIQNGPDRDLFLRAYSWYIPSILDVLAMQRAARLLVGRHDFSSFEAAGAPRKSSVRTVHELRVERINSTTSPRIIIEIEANGFLYNMVRNIVGSLVLVGRGKKTDEWLAKVLAATDRTKAGPTAPARGLTLWNVRYEDDPSERETERGQEGQSQPGPGD